MKVCIFGAGAIGGFLGAHLASTGADVSLVARGAHLDAMRARGVRLQIGGEERRIERLHDLLVAGGLEAPIRDDIRDEIWLKLWGNLCLNPISALTHATLDRITSDPATRSLCRAMMREAQAIGESLGLHLRVDIEKRLDAAGAVGAHRMSMLQDLERGRPLEIEPLDGVVQELGRLTGNATPTLDLVLALVRQRASVAESARGRTERINPLGSLAVAGNRETG